MYRFIFMWIVATAILVVVTYIIDRQTKIDMRKWSFRILWNGGIVACVLGGLVFFERF